MATAQLINRGFHSKRFFKFENFGKLPSIHFISKKRFSDESSGKKGKKEAKNTEEKILTDKINRFVTTFEEANKKFKPKFTEEEQQEHFRIGKEYNKQTTLRQNKTGRDLTIKIWLQKEAFQSLPENLRIEADKVDSTPPPRDRPWPMFCTPPIKDFNINDYVKKEGEEQ